MKITSTLLTLCLAATTFCAAAAEVTVGDTPLKTVLGEQEKFSQEGMGYYPNGASIYQVSYTGGAMHICFGYKGEAYIYNPVSQLQTGTYMIGSTEGTGQYPDIIVPMPQPIFDYETTTGTIRYNIERVEAQIQGTSLKTFSDKDKKEVRYHWNGKAYELVNDSDEGYITALGIYQEDQEFSGFLEYNTTLTPMKDKVLAAPANAAEALPWTLKYGDDMNGAQNGFHVNVVKDGEWFYVQGVGEKILPEAWIRGHIEERDGLKFVVFEPQYLGEYNSYYAYMMPMILKLTYDEATNQETWKWATTDKLEYLYDDENNYLSIDRNHAIGINAGVSRLHYYTFYQKAEFELQNAIDDFRPHNPQITAWNEFKNPGVGEPTLQMQFILFRTNNSEQILDCNNVYYRIYYENEPVTLYPDEYVKLKEPMTEIPYFFTDNYDISIGTTQTTLRSMFFYMYDVDDLGVMSYYKDPETGECSYSDVVYHSGKVVPVSELGVDSAIAGNAVSMEIFDLQGRRVSEDYKGLVIRRSVTEDGTVTVEKVMKNK